MQFEEKKININSYLYKPNFVDEAIKLIYPGEHFLTDLKLEDLLTSQADQPGILSDMLLAIFSWSITDINSVFEKNLNKETILRQIKNGYLSLLEHCWLFDKEYSMYSLDFFETHYKISRRFFNFMENYLIDDNIEEFITQRIKDSINIFSNNDHEKCTVNYDFYVHSTASLITSIGILLRHRLGQEKSHILVLDSATVEDIHSFIQNNDLPSIIRIASKTVFLTHIYPLNKKYKFLKIQLNQSIFNDLIQISDDEYVSNSGFDEHETYTIVEY